MVALCSRLSLAGERGHFVEMRGEQRAAAIALVQMLDRRPGYGEPVEGRGAAADFVQNDQRALAGLIEDRRGLDHLDHESRVAARQIVGGADAREQPVDDADMGGRAGTKLPIWASTAISAFWRRKVDLPAMFGPVTSQMRPVFSPAGGDRSQSLATNGPPLAQQRLLDHRMTAAFDRKGKTGVDLGRDVIALDRQRRERALRRRSWRARLPLP